MKIVLLGYNGLLGSHILSELIKYQKKNNKFNLVCVGRKTSKQPYKNKKIKYVKWNFIDFTKSKLYFLDKENIIINCIGKNLSSEENLYKINVLFVKKLINYIQYNKSIVRLIHLGSVSVYGAEKKYSNEIVNISENSQINPNDTYSKSKIEAEICIQNFSKNNKKNFSFTILRIANVFSEFKNPKSFKLIKFLLNRGIWFKCSNNTNYHFIHAKDIALAVLHSILYFKKSRNKIYILSDDINQFLLHKIYSTRKIFKLLKIPVPLKLVNLFIKNIPLPRIILNFLLTISSQINYNNYKIKNELNFHPIYSLRKKFKSF